MGFLCLITTHILSKHFALPKYIFCNSKDIFDWSKSIGHEIPKNITLTRFGIIIALEIENPVGIEMGMYSHMQSIWIHTYLII